MNEREHALRDKRKELVKAAEAAIKSIFGPNERISLKKTQFNHLVGVCGEAACSEEIENYIRYQASRKSPTGWKFEFADMIINGIKPQLAGLGDIDKVEAWKLYAIFLARAFTYEEEARRVRRKKDDRQDAQKGRPR